VGAVSFLMTKKNDSLSFCALMARLSCSRGDDARSFYFCFFWHLSVEVFFLVSRRAIFLLLFFRREAFVPSSSLSSVLISALFSSPFSGGEKFSLFFPTPKKPGPSSLSLLFLLFLVCFSNKRGFFLYFSIFSSSSLFFFLSSPGCCGKSLPLRSGGMR